MELCGRVVQPVYDGDGLICIVSIVQTTRGVSYRVMCCKLVRAGWWYRLDLVETFTATRKRCQHFILICI